MRKCIVILTGLAVFALIAPLAAENVPVKPTKTIKGDVEDAGLLKDAPRDGVIASKAGLEKLWKSWGIKEEMPTVDFSKELIVVQTTRGSSMSTTMTNNDGNLQIRTITTKDLRPGFRYVIMVIKNDGVKTVNGKELPKE